MIFTTFFRRLRYWEKEQILLQTETKEGDSLFSFLLVPKYIYVGGDFSIAWETLGRTLVSDIIAQISV